MLKIHVIRTEKHIENAKLKLVEYHVTILKSAIFNLPFSLILYILICVP